MSLVKYNKTKVMHNIESKKVGINFKTCLSVNNSLQIISKTNEYEMGVNITINHKVIF